MNMIFALPPEASLQISLPLNGCDNGTVQGLEFMAKELAQLLELSRVYIAYEDQLEDAHGQSYYLPVRTLTLEQARSLGIEGPADLYGGVVPYEFLAYKCVTHPLPQADMVRPQGWNDELSLSLRHDVLPGFSVFSAEDALRTMSLLDQAGQAGIRVKLAVANAGKGQSVVYSRHELEELLALPAWKDQLAHGLVLEENLPQSHTFSVGQTQIGDLLLSYIGQQHQTLNHAGESVYGGTTLLAARGGFDQLFQLKAVERAHYLIDVALDYEKRISAAYPQFYASRRNYDVILGRNGRGEYKAGVLEHSWRCGGASVAEILALRTLQRHPERTHTHAWTRERYVTDAASVQDSPNLYSLSMEDGGCLARFGGPL